MTGASASVGGIATCNLNVLQTLNALSIQTERQLVVLSLHEQNQDRPQFLDVKNRFIGFRGRKLAYALRLMSLFRSDRFFMFDHVRIALPLIPFALFRFDNFVVMAHGSESWRRVRGTSKLLFRKAKICVTNSQYTLDKMRSTFSGFTGQACMLGLSPVYGNVATDQPQSDAGSELRATDGHKVILSDQLILLVGRMDCGEGEKGHRELLTIWPAILRDFPNAQLVLAGPGNDRKYYMQMAKRLKIESTVFIPGYLSTGALRELYSRCYAFVMPSRQEGFGLAYLEAMSFGKPCIACRNGGGAEVVYDGVSGLLIDNPYDNQQLLNAVKKLLGDRDFAARLGQAGLERLHSTFTATHAQERLRRILWPIVQCR
jgi:glycosyltransferase involved in cell wall biosynthesis